MNEIFFIFTFRKTIKRRVSPGSWWMIQYEKKKNERKIKQLYCYYHCCQSERGEILCNFIFEVDFENGVTKRPLE